MNLQGHAICADALRSLRQATHALYLTAVKPAGLPYTRLSKKTRLLSLLADEIRVLLDSEYAQDYPGIATPYYRKASISSSETFVESGSSPTPPSGPGGCR